MAVGGNGRARSAAATGRTEARKAISRRRRRAAGGGFHAFVQCALAVFSTAMAVAILLRYNPDIDITLPFARGVLDDGTRAQIAALSDPLKITAVVERNHIGAAEVRRLLRGIRLAAEETGRELATGRIDPHREPARAAEILEAAGAEANSVIFESRGRIVTVSIDEMFDYTIDPKTGEKRPAAFRGEAVSSAAMARVASTRVPVVYALAGHGERDFADYDQLSGYSTLAREVRRQGYDLRILDIVPPEGVPEDCDVLVVVGPRSELIESEANRISTYVSRGGRMLVFADRGFASGLEPILARFGIVPRPLTAVSARTLTGYDVIVGRFKDHPATKGMGNTSVVFNSPQVIGIAPRRADAPADGSPASGDSSAVMPGDVAPASGNGVADAGAYPIDAPPASDDFVKTVALASAPADSWGETSPDAFPRHFDQGVDAKGELPLIVAASRGTSSSGIAFKEPRIVVVGDSMFGSNAALERGRNGNRDLILAIFDWLADSPAEQAFAPPADPRRPDLSRRGWLLFLLISTCGLPAAVLAATAIYLLARRRRTSPRPSGGDDLGLD